MKTKHLVNLPNSTAKIEIEPRFIHDCKDCVFLGTVDVNTTVADIYYHKGKDVTLLARFSNDLPDYCSSDLEWVSTLNIFMQIALSMYINHLGVKGFSGTRLKGIFSDRDGKILLKLE